MLVCIYGKFVSLKSAFEGKRGSFEPLRVRVLAKIGVFLSRKIREKGVFLNMENTDGLHVMCPSGGTGEQT